MDFYNKFLLECNRIGKSPSFVAEENGLTRAAVNRWKKGGMPSDAVMLRIAMYFGITVDELKCCEAESGQEKKTAQTDGLTDDEQTLIDCYRSMDDAERTAFISFLQSRSNKK